MLNPTTKAYLRKIAAIPTGLMQLVMMVQGLRLEHRTDGLMRLTSKAPRCTTLARRWLGIRGNRGKLLAQAERILEIARRYDRLVKYVRAADRFEESSGEGQVWFRKGQIRARLDGQVQVLATGVEKMDSDADIFRWTPPGGDAPSIGGLRELLWDFGFSC
jgi:hypothetical protein